MSSPSRTVRVVSLAELSPDLGDGLRAQAFAAACQRRRQIVPDGGVKVYQPG